jgi:dihydroflavonol-4-reductase
MKFFLTGATGLVGVHLVRELLDHGHEVVAIVRSEEKAKSLLPSSDRISFHVGDLEKPESMIDALLGCDVAVLAGAYFTEYYTVGGAWEKFKAVNIDGALEILEAAKKMGVRKAVFLSSTGALADGETKLIDEDTITDLYRRSKILGEKLISLQDSLQGFPIITIRPGWIFGPNDPAPTSTGRMSRELARNGSMQMVAGGVGPVVDARDVAKVIRIASEKIDRTTYFNAVSVNLSAATAFRMIASHIPKSKVIVAPFFLTALLSKLYDFRFKWNGMPNPMPLEGLRFVAQEHQVSNQKTIEELGVTFRSFEETARECAEWARNMNSH